MAQAILPVGELSSCTRRYFRLATLAFLFSANSIAISAEVLKVPQHIWDGLQSDQRELLSNRFVISLLAGNAYGNIIDAQSLNESTPGTNVGSQLGARMASAAYVDNAFSGSPRNWNYSATGNLTAQIAGALIGSLADTPAQARFRTRYTIKNGNGSVEYVDEIKSDAFRHSVGLCVVLGPIQPIELDFCNTTREQFLVKHSLIAKTGAPWIQASPPAGTIETLVPMTASASSPAKTETSNEVEKIRCKFGASSPVLVSKSVCDGAGGIAMP